MVISKPPHKIVIDSGCCYQLIYIVLLSFQISSTCIIRVVRKSGYVKFSLFCSPFERRWNRHLIADWLYQNFLLSYTAWFHQECNAVTISMMNTFNILQQRYLNKIIYNTVCIFSIHFERLKFFSAESFFPFNLLQV